MRRLTLFVVLVAFTISCGGQWYVLQAVAWANMIREYSHQVPLTQAVEMTFSGRYPCAICHALAEKRQSDNSKIGFSQQDKKKALSRSLAAPAAPSAFLFVDFLRLKHSLRFRTEAPPTPPPQLA